ncbi:phosphoribosyltransferase [Halopseudomonas nanhaiensis]|uniref:phosphoribosyltransferase n=1 Tax=Halopseudomonas nanhaiensis TaxID=2830842 RepID=UPI001CC09CBB|nr:phosphoribosyltransferase family protein [Halopseudomonas nanhaiensis]UAW98048.1 phosphoribosyltransferase [Halopseudomonas nanhaiensis]
MNYRNVNDLSRLITRHAGQIPIDVDLVVGIPRSGMLVASLVSLKLNLPLTDLYSFLRNDDIKRGDTRQYKHAQLIKPLEARKILLVDDSIASGKSMARAAAQVNELFHGSVCTLVAFAERHNTQAVDMYLELVEQPRVFEWNIMHHHYISHACVDIDGVLCVDPVPPDADDGPNYQQLLANASPLFIPSIKASRLVTTRFERYRSDTEAWLQRHGVEYDSLHMFPDVPEDQRRQPGAKIRFKARIYREDPHCVLFIESEETHASGIMQLADKPVFCIENNEMYVPGASFGAFKAQAMRKSRSFVRKCSERLASLWTGRSSIG